MNLHRVLLSVAMVFTSFEIDYVRAQVWQFTSSLQQALDGLGNTVPCDTVFEPVDCDFKKIPLLRVEDYERCGPLKLNQSSRNYMLAAAGLRITYNENKAAFKRIRIIPKMLRDVSKYSLRTSTLGQDLSFPVGLSPAAMHKLAHPEGEIATVQGMKNMGIVMTLSSYATTTIEDVAHEARGGSSHLWMQTYIFTNRSITKDLVSRAEKAGYEAVVVTIDSPVDAMATCNAKEVSDYVKVANFEGAKNDQALFDKSLTFKDLRWLRSITKLPIIAKGILSARDARSAIRAGASAIFVSNHGGRQMDSDPATIDVLPGIVDAVRNRNRLVDIVDAVAKIKPRDFLPGIIHSVRKMNPRVDVYVDGGIRNGWDVYKCIASGAKLVFIGRPQIYGLAMEGADGVRNVLNILRSEFEEAMLLAGASRPSEISKDTLTRSSSSC